ncbi:MAG: FliO/MopB family protein [Planctomycetaceae bacterium]
MHAFLKRFLPLGIVIVVLAVSATAGDSTRLPPRAEKPAAKEFAGDGALSGKSGSLASWVTTAGALLFVVGLIVVTAKVLRKALPRYSAALPAGAVEVLGRKPLDDRHMLHVVKCGSRILILGSASDGLRALAEITDPKEVDALARLCQPAEPLGFGMGLSRAFGRMNPMDEETPGAEGETGNAAPIHEREPSDAAALRLRWHLNSSTRQPDAAAGEVAEVAA